MDRRPRHHAVFEKCSTHRITTRNPVQRLKMYRKYSENVYINEFVFGPPENACPTFYCVLLSCKWVELLVRFEVKKKNTFVWNQHYAVGCRKLPQLSPNLRTLSSRIFHYKRLYDVGQPTFSQVGRLPEFRLFFFCTRDAHRRRRAHML